MKVSGRREDDHTSIAPLGLTETIRSFLESDKVEASKTAVLDFVHTHSSPNLSEHDQRLLAILENVLLVFSSNSEEDVEGIAKEVTKELENEGLGGTKTAKRLSSLLAILQEANHRVNKIQAKMNAAKKAKLPADYEQKENYVDLKSHHLKVLAIKRPDLNTVQKDLEPLAEYHRGSLFAQLKKKIDDVKGETDAAAKLRELVSKFWESHDKEAYMHWAGDNHKYHENAGEIVNLPLEADNSDLQIFMTSYENSPFRDEATEQSLALIEALLTPPTLASIRAKGEKPNAALIASLFEELSLHLPHTTPILMYLTPASAAEEDFVSRVEDIVQEEARKAEEERSGLRKVFGVINKVAKLKTVRKTGVRVVVMNRAVEVLRKWWERRQKRKAKTHQRHSNSKDKIEEFERKDVESFLAEIDLEQSVVRQLLKLMKRIRERIQDKTREVEWKFKLNFSSEKHKFIQNLKFFKKMIVSSKEAVPEQREVLEQVKAMNRRATRERDSPTNSISPSRSRQDNKKFGGYSKGHHENNGSIPVSQNGSIAPKHIKHRNRPHLIRPDYYQKLTLESSFSQSLVPFLIAPPFNLNQLLSSSLASNLNTGLMKKVPESRQFSQVSATILSFFQSVKGRHFSKIAEYLKGKRFALDAVAKMAGKREERLEQIERKYGGEVKPRMGNLKHRHQGDTHTIRLDGGHKKLKTGSAVEVVDVEDAQLINSAQDVPSGFDKKLDELTGKLYKTQQKILNIGYEEIDDSYDQNQHDENSSEKRYSLLNELDDNLENSKLPDHFFRISDGRFSISEHTVGEKKKFYAEILAFTTPNILDKFTALKESTHLSMKLGESRFKNYLDKVLISKSRLSYTVLPCFLNFSSSVGTISALHNIMATTQTICSIKYSTSCKLFIFPLTSLTPSHMEALTISLLLPADGQVPMLYCLLVCKETDREEPEEHLKHIKVPLIKTDTVGVVCLKADGQGLQLSGWAERTKAKNKKKAGFLKTHRVKPPINKVKLSKERINSQSQARREEAYLGKRSVVPAEKMKLFSLVQGSTNGSNGPSSFSQRNKENIEHRLGSLTDSPLLKDMPASQPRNRNESALLSSFNIIRGEADNNNPVLANSLGLELDPFSSKYYDDQENTFQAFAPGQAKSQHASASSVQMSDQENKKSKNGDLQGMIYAPQTALSPTKSSALKNASGSHSRAMRSTYFE